MPEVITPARLIDGKAIAEDLRQQVGISAADFAAAVGRKTGLAVVLVGDNPASQVYVRSKIKATEAANMRSVHHVLPTDISQRALEALIGNLNADESIDGILLQLPLPVGLDADAAIARIDPAKDVDGLTEVSAGRLALGRPGLRPCTPRGCVLLAQHALSNLTGAHCVIVGRSILVGKPAAQLFLEQNCTVTIAHSRSRDLAAICRSADILVPAVGRPEMVRGSWIKPGATVIDVGINRITAENGQGRLVGDVAFAEAALVAGAITPVPGGVGPMTIACLLANTLEAARARRSMQ